MSAGDHAPASGLLNTLDGLCQEAARAAAAVDADAVAARMETARRRLADPLRVAIAGRVKAGKSTLLNALVGERVAPTDAGECTRIVTWYREGLSYEVRGTLVGGGEVDLAFTRGDAMTVDLGGRSTADLAWLEVSWPSSRLGRMTLIDTPGTEGARPGTGAATLAFLGLEDDTPGEADAVLYLLRRLHRTDTRFLETFAEDALSQPTPVNALAVLSRADEVGAGRPDAMVSARDIAGRYATDPRLQGLCATVVPVAGLIAETAQTMREDEARALALLSQLDAAQVEELTLSADHFRAPGDLPVPAEERSQLLDRLGLFGLRFCLEAIRTGRASTGADLAQLLLEASGIEALRDAVEEVFGRRARALKARSALLALRVAVAELNTIDPERAQPLAHAAERAEAGAHEFAELRLRELIAAGLVPVTEDEQAEIDRLTADGTPADRLGLDTQASVNEVQDRALAGAERWRARAAEPLRSRLEAEAAETIARSYEEQYMATC